MNDTSVDVDMRSVIQESLAWRYATKRFDPTQKIPAALWSTLEEALRMAPSSFGLQPWNFVVVTDPVIREKLLPHSWNQPQIVEASHLVVLASAKDIPKDSVDTFIRFAADTRSIPVARLENYRAMIVQFIQGLRQSDSLEAWTARQTYIALGMLLSCAALLQIDACPLEGIDAPQYDTILGLDAGMFSTRVACALGYRSQSDDAAKLSKVRFPREQVFSYRS